ncbi:MAG TPA: hypothetical protein VFD43_12305, partial [Planctomycetota bacterium]|nr:hypothetical protein [Planctomycetota bacterium]
MAQPSSPLVRLALAALAALGASSSVAAQDDDACLGCHDREEGMLAEEGAVASRPIGELLIDAGLFARSKHGSELSCADCHAGFEAFPHPRDAPTAGCATCHADQADAFA